jgi:hypothetical protein
MDELPDSVLRRDVVPRVITGKIARRRARRRTVPTVVVAEHWQDAELNNLIVFLESGPHPRSATDLT